MQDVIQRLRELRQSSESSVVTGIEASPSADRPSLEHSIEPWLIELVLEELTKSPGPDLSLIVLAGNAGDGKSYLLRAIRERLHRDEGLNPGMVSWLLDATESDHQTQTSTDRLRGFFECFADGSEWEQAKLHIVASNTGALVQFMAADHEQRKYTELCDILGLQLSIRNEPEIDPPSPLFWRRYDRVLVIDLDRRMLFPLSIQDESFLDRMLATLNRANADGFLSTASNSCAACSVSSVCPVNANLTCLESSRVRERLNTLLLDVTLEDRIHLGPRAIWHLIYQLTLGGLDAAALSRHLPMPLCSDIGGLSEDIRASGLFYTALFDAAESDAETDGAAVSTELSRVDPSRRFTLSAFEAGLSAALTENEDLRLAQPLAEDLGLSARVLLGPRDGVAARAISAVRRAFFLSPEDPDPVRHDWLRSWAQALGEHRGKIISGEVTRHSSVSLLVAVLTQLHRSDANEQLWQLQLPWRNLASIFSQLTLKPGSKKVAEDPRVTGPDSTRQGGLRPIAKRLSEQLNAYPLSITLPLRSGPDVRVTWPLFRLLMRVGDQDYVPASLDPERIQHLERIGAAIGAHAAISGGVVVLTNDGGVVCEGDGAGGYDVIPV
jgi:hypothetical protein